MRQVPVSKHTIKEGLDVSKPSPSCICNQVHHELIEYKNKLNT